MTLHKASVLPKSRALFNLYKDIDIYLKTKLRKIVHNVKPNDEKNLNYEACVARKYDLISALNCVKEVFSFKLEGREFLSLAPAEANLFLK